MHEHGGGRVGTAGQPGRGRSKGSVLQQLVLSGVKTPLAGGSPRPHPSCFVQETRLVHGETMGWLSNGMRAQEREGGRCNDSCRVHATPVSADEGAWPVVPRNTLWQVNRPRLTEWHLEGDDMSVVGKQFENKPLHM